MLTVSSGTTVQQWEVWVFARPNHREPVGACGLFHEERGAVHAASLLTDWLHLGAWNENMLDNATDPTDARDVLVMLRSDLMKLGIDPALTHVTARRYDAADHDNCESEVPHDWRVRRDAGSVPRGPHDMVNVRAKRQ